MSNYCNGTCPMYDAENGECCATDEPRVSVKPDAECFFDAYELDNPFVPPKPTNADRIRSMSDEELAEYIFSLGNGPEDCDEHCAYQDECNAEGFNYGTCIKARIKGVTDWLKQPAKEELT